jgi:hypothetical protein
MSCKWDIYKLLELNPNNLFRELFSRVAHFLRRLNEAPSFIVCPEALKKYDDDLNGKVPVKIITKHDLEDSYK